jgi:hypothetical protein
MESKTGAADTCPALEWRRETIAGMNYYDETGKWKLEIRKSKLG